MRRKEIEEHNKTTFTAESIYTTIKYKLEDNYAVTEDNFLVRIAEFTILSKYGTPIATVNGCYIIATIINNTITPLEGEVWSLYKKLGILNEDIFTSNTPRLSQILSSFDISNIPKSSDYTYHQYIETLLQAK